VCRKAAAKLGELGTAKGAAMLAGELQLLASEAGGAAPPTAAGSALQVLSDDLQTERGFRGFDTGVELLDRAVIGFGRKWLSLWVAAPGDGKTAWALQAAAHVAAQGLKVFYASLEMSKETLAQRLASRALRIPLAMIIRNDLSTYQRRQVADFAKAFAELPFIIDDETMVAEEIAGKVRSLAAAGWVADLVVLDYLQLCEAPESAARHRRGNDDQSWQVNSQRCQVMRKLAKELNAHALVLGQMNQDHTANGKKPHPPGAKQLRGGGGWQEADLMVLLWNEWNATRDPTTPTSERMRTLFRIAKNRAGALEDVYLDFEGAAQSFREPPYPEGFQEQAEIF
jgi:replicative DNA helicase